MRQVVTWVMVASCIGCLGEGITGSSTVTGTYTLRTINGSPLPHRSWERHGQNRDHE